MNKAALHEHASKQASVCTYTVSGYSTQEAQTLKTVGSYCAMHTLY